MTRRRRPRSGSLHGGSSSSGNTGAIGASTTAAPAGANQPPAPQGARHWYKIDLHTHTPASSDYEEPHISYLDWLRKAADRGLDIVAITDHNTVAGIAAIRREIEWLARLEQQNRLNDEERDALAAWRDLSNRVLVLPGFEFTATFGFHILGIFPPETSVRTLEHILLSLKVPPSKIDIGSTETGSTTDVLTAYRVIREAGGLAIAAHANSTHGVAMRNFPFGGQTKIAYTQDANLDALEVTDLEHRGYSTARFFDGSKSEYPRRMHSLQGSDAHRLTMDPRNPKRLGIGERATEVQLDNASFEALTTLLRSTAWELVRPARPKERPFDALAVARAAGPSLVQSFHASATKAGGNADAILADICAFANTAGGAVYVGVSLRRDGPQGLARPNQVEQQILEAVGDRIAPSIVVRAEVIKSDNISVLRLQVPRGDERPHAVDSAQIWVRDDRQTRAATRDEIVAMVLEVLEQQGVQQEGQPGAESRALAKPGVAAADNTSNHGAEAESAAGPLPRRPQRSDNRPTERPAERPTERPAERPAEHKIAHKAEHKTEHKADTAASTTTAAQETAGGPQQPAAPAAEQQATQAVAADAGPLVEAATPPAAEKPAAKTAPKPRARRVQKTPVAETTAGTTAEVATEAAIEVVATAAAVAEAVPEAEAQPVEVAPATAAAESKAKAANKPRTAGRKSRVKAESATVADATVADATVADATVADATIADATVADVTAESAAEPQQPAKKGTRSRKSKAAPADETATPIPQMAEAAKAAEAATEPQTDVKPARKAAAPKRTPAQKAAAPKPIEIPLPQIGVEIVESEERSGVWHHSIRDMRNGSIIKGVTRRGARDLWNYAIRALEEKRFGADHAQWQNGAQWQGEIGLLHVEKRAGKMRYDLILRTTEGTRTFYGVTEEGMPEPWALFVEKTEEEEEE